MKKETKIVILAYFIFVLAKFILSYLIPSPSIFSDEYLYSKMARSFFYHGNFLVSNTPVRNYPPLYPILISISYIFKDMTVVYSAMKLINSIVSSLIIFPVYFIAKDFLNHKKSLLISIIVSVASPIFITPAYIMSENLFYPLICLTILFLYKSFETNKIKYFLISGVLLAASFLTRMIGIAIVPITLITYLFKRREIKFTNIVYTYLTSLILVIPWFIRNAYRFGFSLRGILGNYKGLTPESVSSISTKLVSFFSWLALYSGYLILASLILPLIYYVLSYKIKDKNFKTLFIISTSAILFFIILAANQSSYLTNVIHLDGPFKFFTGRPIGRYVEPVLALIITVGLIAYYKLKPKKETVRTITISTSLVLAFSSLLTLGALFPFNNSSLTYLGTFQYIIEYIFLNKTSTETTFHWQSFLVMLTLFIILPFIVYKLKDHKRVILAIFVFLLFNSALAYSVTYWNSYNNWYKTEPGQLGLYFNKLDKQQSSVLFDKEGCTSKILKNNPNTICSGHTTLIGFWMNNEIGVDSINNLKNYDYVITFKNLDLELIGRTESNINLYKTK